MITTNVKRKSEPKVSNSIFFVNYKQCQQKNPCPQNVQYHDPETFQVYLLESFDIKCYVTLKGTEITPRSSIYTKEKKMRTTPYHRSL